MNRPFAWLMAFGALTPVFSGLAASGDDNGVGAPPPAGAIVLFDGETNRFLSKNGEACEWPVVDGSLVSTAAETRSNHIVSSVHFQDARIHVEFQLPKDGGPCNSGVYIHGLFEMQIYDSATDEKLTDGMMGAVYGIAPPLENAAKRPGPWQAYDITYISPRRDDKGNVVEAGSITAYLDGVHVQKDVAIREPVSKYHPFRHRTTPYLGEVYKNMVATGHGPLFLQDHDCPVRFRNVWIVPLDDGSRANSRNRENVGD